MTWTNSSRTSVYIYRFAGQLMAFNERTSALSAEIEAAQARGVCLISLRAVLRALCAVALLSARSRDSLSCASLDSMTRGHVVSRDRRRRRSGLARRRSGTARKSCAQRARRTRRGGGRVGHVTRPHTRGSRDTPSRDRRRGRSCGGGGARRGGRAARGVDPARRRSGGDRRDAACV